MDVLKAVFVLALLALGCGPGEPQGTAIDATVDEVLCANWASHALLTTLLGDAVPIHCLLADANPSPAQAGSSPKPNAADGADATSHVLVDDAATQFQPSRPQLQRLQRARLVVLSGNTLEPWAERSNLASSRVIDCGRPLLGHLIQVEGKAHSHGAGGEHSHQLPNPYVWLDPVLLQKQADALALALQRAFPAHADAIGSSHQQLVSELGQLHQDWKQFASSVSAMPEPAALPGSHAALKYLSRRYGLVFAGADDPAIDSLLTPSDRPLLQRLRGNLDHLKSLL